MNEDHPDPNHIFIRLDDMLAGGSHYKGMKIILGVRYPGLPISGLFLARAIHPTATLLAYLDPFR